MKLNPTIKHHIIIGALICVWSFMFTLFSRPFEHGQMDFTKWLFVGVGYSLIAFISYAVVTWTQKVIYEKLAKWNITLEIGIYAVFYLVYTFSTYAYYHSKIIDGIYDFPEYFVKIIFNIIIIFTPLIILARHYSIKLIPKKDDKEEEIIIKGANKLDFLKIKSSDLIGVSNSQNYVEIFYLENETLKTKLIRNSLKNIQSEFSFLIQIHRSHLINPKHFKSWKDSNTINLSHIELPVSKTYKNNLLSL